MPFRHGAKLEPDVRLPLTRSGLHRSLPPVRALPGRTSLLGLARRTDGAGNGNRTRSSSLATTRATTTPYLRKLERRGGLAPPSAALQAAACTVSATGASIWRREEVSIPDHLSMARLLSKQRRLACPVHSPKLARQNGGEFGCRSRTLRSHLVSNQGHGLP